MADTYLTTKDLAVSNNYPFTPEIVFEKIKALARPETFGIWACTLIAAAANHVVGSPAIWKALGLISVVGMCCDILSGSIRSVMARKLAKAKALCLEKDPSAPDKDFRGTFNSRDLGSTFIKASVYMLFVFLATTLDISTNTVLGTAGVYACSVATLAAIAFREISSNIENAKDIFQMIHQPWPFSSVEGRFNKILKAITSKSLSDDDCNNV